LLLPALYNLAATGLLPERFAIVGVARSVRTADEFRQELLDALQAHATQEVDPQLAQRLVAHAAYVSGSIDGAETFSKLKASLGGDRGSCRYTGQSAVLPGHATGHLRAYCTPAGQGWSISGGSLRRPVAPGGR
jgi:glucose-6-phosphate 1-dehydrogenase